ncbi:MAG: hypothetical protein HYR66_09510 [Sphingobacteriales bacterium]|nr:hypothetical protein [Sphingobacteriales bacterium]MBI3719855.1 hypothetical protein [Sphingobacteriales bacterium]
MQRLFAGFIFIFIVEPGQMMKRLLYLLLSALFTVCVIQCKKEYSYERAAGTLKDSLQLCRPVEIAGHYQSGVSVNGSGNYVTVTVNVTKTGDFHIATDTVNGVYFTASGKFGNLGLQQVKLKASGTPLEDQLSLFTCVFDTSICSFSININKDVTTTPPPVSHTIPLNTWRFWDSTDHSFHHGPVDLTSTWFQKQPDGTNYLLILGWNSNGTGFNKDTVFMIELFPSILQIDTGVVSIADGVGNDNSFNYANNTVLPQAPQFSYFYFYHATKNKNPEFYFHLISYDTATKKLKGEFRGSAQRRKGYSDNPGNIHSIYGQFYFQFPN